MISLLAVVMLSFCTLYLGVYVAERVEQRCGACPQTLDQPVRRPPEE